jgi:hypothetical protein
MFLLHEPLWWVFISGAIGYFCGWGKGRPGAGLLLGLFLGPLGCLAIMLLPPAARRPHGAGGIFGGGTASGPFGGSSTGPFNNSSAGPLGGSSERPALGPTCPRCQKPVARSARACPHCGNVLMPIRYAVE